MRAWFSLLFLVGCPEATPTSTEADTDTDTDADTDTDTDADTDADTDSDTDTDSDADIQVDPDVYRFPSRDDGTVDSVSYSGQVFRQLLIDDLKGHIGGLTQRLDAGLIPTVGQIEDELEFYFEFDSTTAGTLEHGLLDPVPLQTTYDGISSNKNLVEKLAGNDSEGQHQDWTTDLQGWPGQGSAEGLVRDWFAELDAAALQWSLGVYPADPSGAPVDAVYLTADGRDLQQLIQKFLRVGIAFSQGADDYMDDDTPGKGLLADHTELVEGKAYTALEHAWDEGFGYFGAARTYGSWTDAEIAGGTLDIDGDATIDLLTEKSWGHSVNAGKRDAGAVVATDFTARAFEAFHAGRALMADADGALDTAQMETLTGHRDQALDAWERAIAATVVHYINDTIRDMEAAEADYVFADHAKHWSEMKGFALGLQFRRDSPLSDTDFVAIHDAMGTAPVLPNAPQGEQDTYLQGLLSARATLGTAYGFDPANLGDDHGQNGW